MHRYHHTDRKGATIRTGDDLLDEMRWHRENEASAVLYRSADGVALYLRTTSPLGRAERVRREHVAKRITK